MLEENAFKQQVLEDLIMRNFTFNVHPTCVELPSTAELVEIFEVFSKELIEFD